MSSDKLYTIELKRVLTLIDGDIINDFPTKTINIDYFIYAILSSKQCFAYKSISQILGNEDVDLIYNYYSKRLHDNAQPTLPPKNTTQKVVYDATLSKHLIDADKYRLILVDPKISTEHVLLSILGSDEQTIGEFNKIGITKQGLLTYINDIRLNADNKAVTAKGILESIGGHPLNKPSKKNAIDSYCVNLNNLAKQGKIDKLIGREVEINRAIKVIGRRTKNNIIFVGLPGVGKTAIVHGLANMIESGKANHLNDKIILSLNMTAIIAGTTYRGMLEDRMNNLINEIKSNNGYILFIDDIHTAIGGNTNNANEISSILSNALSDATIQLIATTSFKEYKSIIENNSTLNRRFQKIIIEPTSISDTENILLNSKTYYETYHGVKYSESAIKACVRLANKYITEKQLPDSAIDIMDECGSEKKASRPQEDELVELKKDLAVNSEMVRKSMRVNDFKLADEYNKKSKEIQAKIIDVEKKLKVKLNLNLIQINESDIYVTISEMTGIPLNKLSINEKQKYLNIENILSNSIIGQEDAIKKVSQTIKRNRVGLDRKNKPIGVFLCIGESGVGKTLLAKKLAEEIYGGENMLVRFDMSEYSDKTSVNKMIGSGAGYVGYEAGGQLTEMIKNKKHCVLLLDEIEKADKDILNVFLQVFDDGNLTDNTGQKVSFKNVIILMTSNIGAKDATMFSRSAGFNSNVSENKKSISEKALKQHFPPEFINRLDGVVYFNQLTKDNLIKIIGLEIENLNIRLHDIGYGVEYGDGVVEYLYDKVKDDPAPGARKICRVIQMEIENVISDLCLENEFQDEYIFNISVKGDKLMIK